MMPTDGAAPCRINRARISCHAHPTLKSRLSSVGLRRAELTGHPWEPPLVRSRNESSPEIGLFAPKLFETHTPDTRGVALRRRGNLRVLRRKKLLVVLQRTIA